ncbi:helix-turn-helix transcriptional regulator [Aquimarina sp. TRL1]|uniref:helix-turn-helix domain-containing protein n=1 Tax=Aquimarina sp. (strain TRL1) TaxID=2736252 RepID=UPI00158E8317|nr:AraC family transcriptional regulator [Aquimarina sp. TRL1]QKX06166.1 helix-turn-helix transcriptional regulator [Aquimarina sp. TRL1]
MIKQLKEGQYFGELNHKLSFNGITVTDTEYTHDYVDWHSHENPYFTFLLQGKLIEENKKEKYTLSQGALLFHNWQDFHRNIKPPEFTRGAHIEINRNWAKKLNFDITNIEGSIKVQDSYSKNLVFKILLESKQSDNFNQASIELLLLQLLSRIKESNEKTDRKKPHWFKKLEELIYENSEERITLEQISNELKLHPVYLSRTFHKFYGKTFGQYCREIRLNKTLNAILTKKHTLTDIAYLMNYYDQSHMILEFKKHLKYTPKEVIKILG